ncbi:hypothetical protein CNX65_30765 [Actinosynnema pretiosum]|uniref:Uncharacterized protein n=1 Tax=Actinosynnema pretiosum TaxID=42197 RepID=A0A290ZDR5_9PSEU|nr:hypothetical protein CNX65_30765 [Actinosynnema pretiosum]
MVEITVGAERAPGASARWGRGVSSAGPVAARGPERGRPPGRAPRPAPVAGLVTAPVVAPITAPGAAPGLVPGVVRAVRPRGRVTGAPIRVGGAGCRGPGRVPTRRRATPS